MREEMCQCGHYRSEHEDPYGPDVGPGQGACTKCDCPRFTWVSFCNHGYGARSTGKED